MKTLRWVFVSAALVTSAACSGGGGSTSHPATVVPNVSSPGPVSTTAVPTSTMTITISRATTTTTSLRRGIQQIPATAISVDAQIYSGTNVGGTVLATSCVAFPMNATQATLTLNAPQGPETIRISSWNQPCSGSGGQGTTGTGSILSSFTGSGTVLPTSTDLGTVFNSGTGISLVPSTYPFSGYWGWGPASVANAFQFPSLSGYDGTGTTIAIVIDSALTAGDLNTYLNYFHITRTGTVTFKAVGTGSATAVTADVDEATLDVETIAGLAPGANIIVYEIDSLNSNSIDLAYNTIITDGLASVVNNSFGGCESSYSQSVEAPILASAAAAKIAFVASTGDQGGTCYSGGSQVAGINYPAADPNAIAAGGTDANPLGNLTDPVVWNDGPGYGAGGGGVSTIFTKPSYQTVSGLASATQRNTPDLSLPATYAAIYESTAGGWGVIDGTSWSAPEISAELAGIFNYCQTALANPASLPYTAYTRNAASFIDVTSGNTDYTWSVPGSFIYTAVAGYDNASGIGMPLGMPIAQALCPNRVPSVSAPLVAATMPLGPATDVVVPATTNVARFGTDQGQRAPADTTEALIVLRPMASIASNEQLVVSALQSAGFTIAQRFSNHLVIDTNAPNATVQSYFGTTVHTVMQGSHGARAARTAALTIPAAIAPYVSGVNLGNLVTAAAIPVHRR